jgi:aspartate aminotransferase
MAAGFSDAREAVAADLSARFSLEVSGNEIFLTCGAAPALISVIKALAVSPEAEIIVPAPFFPEYIPFISSNGAKPVIVPANPPSFQIDPQAVARALTDNTQAVLINSPNNPSGVVFSEETLRALGQVLEQASEQYGHPIYIISDEPYRELVYGNVTVPFVPSIYRNTIVCYSYSKSLSLPGERIGYVYVPSIVQDSSEVYAAVAGAARSMGHVCAPTLMQQVIARCAGERPDLRAYEENRNLLYSKLTEMGYECVHPDGAFYLLVKAPGGDAAAFSEKAKLEQNLLLVPGEGFGAPGYLRLSYCVSHEMILRSLPAFQAMLK